MLISEQICCDWQISAGSGTKFLKHGTARLQQGSSICHISCCRMTASLVHPFNWAPFPVHHLCWAVQAVSRAGDEIIEVESNVASVWNSNEEEKWFSTAFLQESALQTNLNLKVFAMFPPTFAPPVEGEAKTHPIHRFLTKLADTKVESAKNCSQNGSVKVD